MNARQSWSGRKVLVTGASGFLGSHLCRRLVADGAMVHGTYLNRAEHCPAGVVGHRADLTDAEEVSNLVSLVRPEVLFHLAGLPKKSRAMGDVLPALRGDLLTTIHILQAATQQRCRRVIVTGSLEEPIGCGDEIVPCSPYAAAKWASTAQARMFHDLYGTPVVITRVYMAYGPRQTATKIIPYTIRSLLAGETPQLGSGERLVDWIYVEDAIDGIVTLASAPGIEGRTIDLGSGVLLPIRDVVKRIATLLDSPLEPAFGALPAAPRENVRVADVAATLATIGWRNTTLLDDGLRQTIDWYRGLAATSTADATPAPCYSAISTSERNQVRQPQKLTFFSATEVQQP